MGGPRQIHRQGLTECQTKSLKRWLGHIRRSSWKPSTPVFGKGGTSQTGRSIIGFADDALGVCATDDVRILEKRINESLWRAKRLLDSTCQKMAPDKTEALLITNRRFFQFPKIVLGDHENEWKKSIKYLGVQLDRRQTPADRECQSDQMWSRSDSAHAQHWCPQGSQEKAGGEHSKFEAALRSSGLDKCR